MKPTDQKPDDRLTEEEARALIKAIEEVEREEAAQQARQEPSRKTAQRRSA